MKHLISLASVLALALFLAVPAHADGAGKSGEKPGKGKRAKGHLFAKFDKDGSGTLTSDEVPAKLWERISKADADGDGAVSKDEAKAARKGKKGRCKGKGKGKKGKGGSSSEG